MDAAVVRDFAEGPRYDRIDLPAAAEGEVEVQVLAAALSPRVRSAASGRHYTSRGELPMVPGLDGVGRLPDGRRVYFVAARDAWGTLAASTLADARLVLPLPEGASAAAVAALVLPAMSSWVALGLRARLAAGEKVLVLGATGTSGQLAVQIARHLGAGQVVAAGRDAAALERTRALGADQVVRLDGGRGAVDALARAASEVDVVLDYLWGDVSSAALPALCRARRADETHPLRWVLIGSAAGDELTLSSVLLRKRNLTILGSGQGACSTREMFGAAPKILEAFAAGRLQLQVREAPLAEVGARWTEPLASGERLVFVP